METWLLTNLSSLALAVGMVAVAVALTVLGLLLVRRSVELSTLESHHDVAGFILAVIGVVYAVLLAFVVIVVWQQFEDAKADATEEAVLVGNLYRDTVLFGERGGEARQALRRYARSVVDREWPQMAEHHRGSRATDQALNHVWRSYRALGVQRAGEEPFYAEAVRSLHSATELREIRISNSGAQLPGAMWAVLIAGAVISIGFTYFFGVGNFAAQVLMMSALAAIVGLALFLIVSLDLPYTGDVGVHPAAMQEALQEFREYATLRP
jgi:hypothetical protein